MKYDLLPCPFCGSRDITVIDAAPSSYAVCDRCGTFGPIPCDTGDAREAVALWNQRLDSEREPEE